MTTRQSADSVNFLAIADGRCNCPRCVGRTEDIYRMAGRCLNCGGDVLMIFRSGDPTRKLDCPLCGCWSKVTALRRATDDEIPAAVLPASTIEGGAS